MENFSRKIRNVLTEVDTAKGKAGNFRGVVLMGDKNKGQAYCWIHAPQKDLVNLLVHAMRESDEFAYCAAKAMETRYEELSKENKNN